MIQLLIFALLLLFLFRYFPGFVAFLVEYQYKQRMTRGMAGPENLPIIGCVHKAPNDSHCKLVGDL
jgi:hypothetical protein